MTHESHQIERLCAKFMEIVHDSLRGEDCLPGTPFDDWRKLFKFITTYRGKVPSEALAQCRELFLKLPPRRHEVEIEFTD